MNKFAEDTAIGIVTCNRQDFLKILLDSLDFSVGDVYILNAGNDLTLSKELDNVKEVLTCDRKPTPVGHAKNKLLRHMRHSGKKYLFLIEDDVRIKDNKVFEKYITTAAETGLWAGQLSYGRHGGVKGGNVRPDGVSNVKDTVQYENCSVDLYPQSFQAFTLYHANTLKILGYFDDFYINAAEHLDHYYKAYQLGLGVNFWWFPDIENSGNYIEDIDQNHSNSVIRSGPDWKANMTKSWMWFKKKYGGFPSELPCATKEKVLERLEFLEQNYNQKQLI